ncbi:unnamed protein product [Lathyrus sativus]|nr:unnamed protein product [Lathyrus sativus]
MKPDNLDRSFSKVVRGDYPKSVDRAKGGVQCIKLELDDEWSRRLNRMRVGEVMEDGNAFNIQKLIFEEGYFNIKATPLGASLCLLEDTSRGDLEVFVKEAREWIDIWSRDIRKWHMEEIDRVRIVWVNCYGLPCVAWSEKNFRQISSSLGSFVKCDEKTRNKEKLDIARFLIKTRLRNILNNLIDIEVNNHSFSLSFIEDLSCGRGDPLFGEEDEVIDSDKFDSSNPLELDGAWEIPEEEEESDDLKSLYSETEARAPNTVVQKEDGDFSVSDNVSVVGDNLGLSVEGDGSRGNNHKGSAALISSKGTKLDNSLADLELNQSKVDFEVPSLNRELVVDLGLPLPISGSSGGVIGPAVRGKAKKKKHLHEVYNCIKIPYTPSYFSTLLLTSPKENLRPESKGKAREESKKNKLSKEFSESSSVILCRESITTLIWREVLGVQGEDEEVIGRTLRNLNNTDKDAGLGKKDVAIIDP